jgi:hypothetical protein
MTVASHNQHSILMESVYQLIRKKVDKSTSDLVVQFAQTLYNTISKDDLESRNDSDLYAIQNYQNTAGRVHTLLFKLL